MVQFAPYTNPDRDPKYDFREPDGRKASSFWGDVAKGGAKLLDEGLKGFDTATKLTLDDETSGFVNTLRNQNIAEYKELTGNVLAAQATPQGATGGATGGQSPNSPVPTDEYGNVVGGLPAANTTPPGPIASELRHIDKINEGMRQGHFDSERFYGEVQARTANLVSRYPGYADYIQAKVTHYLGTDPANAQREHLQQTIRQLVGGSDKAQTMAEKWAHEVMTNYAPVMGPAFTQAALQAGTDPAAQQQFRVMASDRLHFDYGQKRDKEGYELKKAAGIATQDDAVQQATQFFDGEHSRMLSTSTMAAAGWSGKIQDVHDNLAMQRLNGGPDIEQNKAMALAVGGMRAGWEANFEQEWVKPRYGRDPKTGAFTESYSTLIKDQAVKEQFIKKYRTIFESLERQVGAGQFDLATVVSDLSARKLDGAVAGLYTNRAVLALAAGSKVFGQAFDTVYGAANLRSNMALNDQLSQTFLKSALGITMAEGAKGGNNLLDTAQKLKAAMDNDPRYAFKNLPPKFLETLMTNLTTVITHPAKEIPVEVKYNAVEVLSNPNTPGFINLITPEQQFKAYGVLYSPDVSDHIKQFKATEIWNRYKESAGESFNTVFGVFANDVQKYIKQDYKGTFEWNEKTQQILYTPARIGLATDRNRNPVSMAVDRLNEGLRVYADILKRDGEVITPKHLEALGVDVNKQTENTNLEKMLKTLRNIPVQTTASERVDANTPAPMNVKGITSKPAAPATPPTPATPSKEDQGNGVVARKGPASNLSQEEIDQHSIRPLKIDGKEILEPQEKINILKDVMRTPEGKYYYRKGLKLYPINLE